MFSIFSVLTHSTPLPVRIALLLLPIVILGITPRLWITSIIATFGYLVLMIIFLGGEEYTRIAGRWVWLYSLVLAAYLVWAMLINSTYSEEMHGFNEGLYFIVIILVLSISISSLCQRPEDIRYILLGYVVLGSVVAILSVVFNTRAILGTDRYQWAGNLCAINAVILLQFWVIRNRFVALTLSAISCIGILVIAARQSVAIMAAGTFTVILLNLLRWRDNKRNIVILLGILILVMVLWNHLMGLEVSSIMLDRLSSLDRTGYGLRSKLYLLAWNAFREHPMSGIGIGEFVVTYTGDKGLFPHNVFLEILCELGVFGAIIFFIPLFWAGYQMARQWIILGNPSFGSLLSLWVCFLTKASISGTFVGNRSMWLYGILMLHFISIAKVLPYPAEGGREDGCQMPVRST